ncbi:Uma2 family endonuclease [Streptomyces sp. TRM66268-LWL]|uniref:Uma2 family endonuclease n=1 Tax=Streptomyces polyasparticus TaxID=2767826 RepID=A0ABR7SQI3_9ACTN|nr:Uma2 family endonuclease [Streptomyces polyasparticus]MBC9717634.1 Uma2 family endonuclease [Streptomyces polyasparticus]
MTERSPTMDASGEVDFDSMLRTVEQMDTPDGWKAELIRGKIVVSPRSKIRYAKPMRLLRKQLAEHAPEGHEADSAPFLFAFPSAHRAYGPDLHVADEAAFEGEGRHADGAALSLVAEFTAVSTRDADWDEKLEVYGRVVPVYLVVDMQVREITVFWDPSPKGYQGHRTVAFGKPVRVPEPFGFELDTSGFGEAGSADSSAG